ncbi:hypothetical protein TEA_024983 [Camellia sinensis var. sinensis]|uniref:F-box domain-containing protein n=1 Tax=Camellia sinensis var. sinensis TaxID=542762 RepID=A0A4S4DG48_CAMSN|nr:hypothetical protein TEA_024983 [Camellia sinensis var. sinensis]
MLIAPSDSSNHRRPLHPPVTPVSPPRYPLSLSSPHAHTATLFFVSIFSCIDAYANTANATFVSVFSKEHNPSIILLGKRPIYATLVSGNDPKPIDRLTEMPDEILSFILSFLSIRDSVKARILSRRWRYICPFMLNLDFDLHTVLGINYKARYSNGDSDISWEDKSKFVTGVDQFLELYNGQKLLSLRICFCLGNEHAGYVDRWIRFAIIMKTEKLDLEFSASPESQSNKLYDFPCQLLPQGDSSQLKYLCLKSCNLRPTPNLASRLVSLKSLDLEHVPLNQSCANSILSSCLNLEWLRLKNSILPETLCIHGPSLHLKILIVHECYRVEKFEISSIGLTTFEYIGEVKNFSFLDVPRLEKVHIRFMVAYERGTQYMFNGIANDLPWLQTLSLVLTTDEVLPIPARITRFNSLKQLELFVMVSSDFNLLSLTLLLNASPLLQKLHLSWRQRWSGGGGGVEVVVVLVLRGGGICDADIVIGKPGVVAVLGFHREGCGNWELQ